MCYSYVALGLGSPQWGVGYSIKVIYTYVGAYLTRVGMYIGELMDVVIVMCNTPR